MDDLEDDELGLFITGAVLIFWFCIFFCKQYEIRLSVLNTVEK